MSLRLGLVAPLVVPILLGLLVVPVVDRNPVLVGVVGRPPGLHQRERMHEALQSRFSSRAGPFPQDRVSACSDTITRKSDSHLWPDSEERTREAFDEAWRGAVVPPVCPQDLAAQ